MQTYTRWAIMLALVIPCCGNQKRFWKSKTVSEIKNGFRNQKRAFFLSVFVNRAC
ncbi:MAG: hypothetical protein P8176_01890 [Gammaproteobacteria bacterium]